MGPTAQETPQPTPNSGTVPGEMPPISPGAFPNLTEGRVIQGAPVPGMPPAEATAAVDPSLYASSIQAGAEARASAWGAPVAIDVNGAIAATPAPTGEPAFTPSPIVTKEQAAPGTISTAPAATQENPYAMNGVPPRPDLSAIPDQSSGVGATVAASTPTAEAWGGTAALGQGDIGPINPIPFAQMTPEATAAAGVMQTPIATATTEIAQPAEIIAPSIENTSPTPPPTEPGAQQPDILATRVESSSDQEIMKIMADATVALNLARGTNLNPKQQEKLEDGVVEAATRRLTYAWGVPLPGEQTQNTSLIKSDNIDQAAAVPASSVTPPKLN